MLGAILMAATSQPKVTVSGHTTNDPLDTSATVEFNLDGNVYETTAGGGAVQIDTELDWLRPTDLAPGAYEIMASVNSGTVSSGDNTDEWLALTTSRSWSTTTSVNLTIQIRLGTTVLASGTYDLTA